MNRAKSKKVANSTFSIVINKVLIREDLSVIETARQNVLAIFPLKNTSKKLPLVAFGLFFLSLAGSSSSVKVLSKKHTWVSSSVVSTAFKNPKIFNNRLVNKLVFSALTTFTTTSITTALQMAMKTKNSKKQQQTVATALVTPNPFVIPDKILGKIFTAAASPLLNIDGNSSGISSKIGQDQLLVVLSNVILFSRLSPILMKIKSTVPSLVSGAADGSAWENVNGRQRFSGWIISNLLLPGCIGLKSVSQDAVKLLHGLLVWSLVLLFSLHNISLGTSFNNIKTALGIFGVVISVKLKPAGLWQYAVVNFKNISSAAAALFNWFVLIRKDNVRIFLIDNQKEIISSRDVFKAKLVNLLFGCTAFEISDLVSQVGGYLNYLAVDCKISPPLPPKFSFNTSGGSKVFKSLFAGSKSYVKAAVFVVPPAAADMDLNLGDFSKTVTSVLPAVSSAPNFAVESKLASLESHLSELSVLIKSLVESVGALIVLVTKFLSTPTAMDMSVKKYVDGLAKQNKDLAAIAIVIQKRITCLEKKCEQICLEDKSDNDNMVDDNDNNDKDFLVYDNTFDIMIHL
ncbi:hypothetical protein G9A89_002424 [Geosiphon pyriformis]|nr:hypothetical protein G9A89_002424 [Geosiphon pyriformis]